MEKIKILSVCNLSSRKFVGRDGQSTKSINVSNFIKDTIPNVELKYFEYGVLKKNPILLFFRLSKALKNVDAVLIFPGSGRALRLLLGYISKKKRKYAYKIYYPVVGGFIVKELENHHRLIKLLTILDGIYVETKYMQDELARYELNNIHLSPVFSLRKMIDEKHLNLEKSFAHGKRLRLYTFSRVVKEKGIGLAIDAVKKACMETGCGIDLNIYGVIDPIFKEEFEGLISNSNIEKCNIQYGGELDDAAVIKTISKYHAMLFPSFYEGEGFPATVLEAFMAGTPVIASKWASNESIIQENVNGFLFKLGTSELQKRIEWCFENIESLVNMKANCLKEARKYIPEKALAPLVNDIKRDFHR